MARVAILTIVNIPAHTIVIGVCLGFGMTRPIHAREYRVVGRIRVTRCADSVRSAVTCREPRVIERRTGPACRCVARLTRRWETGRRVIRIRRAIVVR